MTSATTPSTSTKATKTEKAAKTPTGPAPKAEGETVDPGEAARARLDAAIGELHLGSRTWSALTLDQRVTLLRGVRTSVAAVAEDWAATAASSKGLDSRHPLRGEEWLSGPYSVLGAIDAYIETLSRLAAGTNPLDGPPRPCPGRTHPCACLPVDRDRPFSALRVHR